MVFDTSHINWKKIAIVWVILGIIFGGGLFVLMLPAFCGAIWLESGYDEDEAGVYIRYFGAQPPYPPQWSVDGTTILLSWWGTTLVKTGVNGVSVEPLREHVAHASLSPDGTRIAFATLRHGDNYEIGISNLDGSRYRRLTKTRYFNGNPVWSPDGSRIAFLSNRPIDDDDENASATTLYTMNADGSDVRRLASQVARIGLQAWSPDGLALAFMGYEITSPGGEGNHRSFIYTVNHDGSNLTKLIESVTPPAWAPNGSAIAFLPGDRPVFLVINPDGTGLREIVSVDPNSVPSKRWDAFSYLSWSPDGAEILLQIEPLVLAKTDGSSYGVFKGLNIGPSLASWSPDGSRIAVDIQGFSSSGSEYSARVSLFTMTKDGSDKRVLVRQTEDYVGRFDSLVAVHNEPWETEENWVWYSSEE